MQLSPGERSILAYFPTSDTARQAAEELKNSGCGDASVDRISRYGTNNDDNYDNPVNGAVTGAGLTLYSDGAGDLSNDDERVLLGADPSNSGYGDTDYGVVGGRSFLLTLVTSEDELDRAKEVIENHGGYF